MKKLAVLLIVLSFAGRVVCCGKSVDLNSEVYLLNEEQNTLSKQIDQLLLTNSELNSFTKSLTYGVSNDNLVPVSYSFTHNSAIALSH